MGRVLNRPMWGAWLSLYYGPIKGPICYGPSMVPSDLGRTRNKFGLMGLGSLKYGVIIFQLMLYLLIMNGKVMNLRN
ncbi:hypothetical protein ACE6H2_021142 [Prunus campanulata]